MINPAAWPAGSIRVKLTHGTWWRGEHIKPSQVSLSPQSPRQCGGEEHLIGISSTPYYVSPVILDHVSAFYNHYNLLSRIVSI